MHSHFDLFQRTIWLHWIQFRSIRGWRQPQCIWVTCISTPYSKLKKCLILPWRPPQWGSWLTFYEFQSLACGYISPQIAPYVVYIFRKDSLQVQLLRLIKDVGAIHSHRSFPYISSFMSGNMVMTKLNWLNWTGHSWKAIKSAFTWPQPAVSLHQFESTWKRLYVSPYIRKME